MDRLSPLDAAFLAAEDEAPCTSMAIASVAILAGSPPAQQEFTDFIRDRLPLIPRWSQTVRTVPFDLGQPFWVDTTAVDLGFHIRRTALPAPGDEAALRTLVGRIMSQRMDRDRPLWKIWVIEGLAGHRWAILSKVHHCMADGSLEPSWTTSSATAPEGRERRTPSRPAQRACCCACSANWR